MSASWGKAVLDDLGCGAAASCGPCGPAASPGASERGADREHLLLRG
ncbi:hypothetical protein HMPREF9057_01910 [Actinomyces sp. oral taxon 171 str. F0337]|nr:hypothetical protein HMPREF9057_01910 [Actinomyces sp. oral taxon 171 str. F0337]